MLIFFFFDTKILTSVFDCEKREKERERERKRERERERETKKKMSKIFVWFSKGGSKTKWNYEGKEETKKEYKETHLRIEKKKKKNKKKKKKKNNVEHRRKTT